MLGVMTWVVCGVVAGYVVNQIISGHDKGLVLLTLSVGIGGAIAGGFIASLFGQGTGATFSFYALLFAVGGASIALFAYRRLIGV